MDGCSSEASLYFANVIEANCLLGQSIIHPEVRGVEDTGVCELEVQAKKNVNDFVKVNHSAADKLYSSRVNQFERRNHDASALSDLATNTSHTLGFA